jgi:hypothetical protein
MCFAQLCFSQGILDADILYLKFDKNDSSQYNDDLFFMYSGKNKTSKLYFQDLIFTQNNKLSKDTLDLNTLKDIRITTINDLENFVDQSPANLKAFKQFLRLAVAKEGKIIVLVQDLDRSKTKVILTQVMFMMLPECDN